MIKKNLTPPRGFTLIEFIIVVAIIAILAAIAVPNFLEAQVRSIVSKSRADLGITAQALEAYYNDHAAYPLFIHPGSGMGGNRMDSIFDAKPIALSINSTATGARDIPSFATPITSAENGAAPFAHLTTPVAYISQYPIDAFDPHNASTFGYAADGSAFILTAMGPNRNAGPQAPAYTEPGQPGIVASQALASQIEQGLNDPLRGDNLRRTRNIFRFWEYDPTNGTVSLGEITYISE